MLHKIISVDFEIKRRDNVHEIINDLNQIDALDKKTYKTYEEQLGKRLAALQLEASRLGIPSMIVLEGFDTAALTGVLLKYMDRRSATQYAIQEASAEDKQRPFMWRFWQKIPAKGDVRIFSHSWYADLSHREVHGKHNQTRLDAIHSFEEQLTQNGVALIKINLDVPQSEQKKRIAEFIEDGKTYKVTKHLKEASDDKYPQYHQAMVSIMHQSHTDTAPWIQVNAKDERYAVAKGMAHLIEAFESAIETKKISLKEPGQKPQLSLPEQVLLDDLNMNVSLTENDYKTRMKAAGKRLSELQGELINRGIPVVAVFEGKDAAGKGGAIKRIIDSLDADFFNVNTVAAPTPNELNHHYLWRFWNTAPKDGIFSLYDRSWYGRVLVEPVEGFCTQTELDRAYGEINDMEKQWAQHGAIVIKFWLQISDPEQMNRFVKRQDSPDILRNQKITLEDFRNREKSRYYDQFASLMIEKTNTNDAPWVLIPANDKYYSRVMAMESLVAQIEKHLSELDRH